MRSGWCSAAPGARPKCAGCRMDGCACGCHETRMVERDSATSMTPSKGQTWENGASPTGALTPAGTDHRSILETNGG